MGIEPTLSAWKAEVLPLNYIRLCWSGRRDSNSRPSPWQGDALPLSHFRVLWWREKDLNLRSLRQQIYSLPPLAAREPLHIYRNPKTMLHLNPGESSCHNLFWSWRRESNPQPADYKSAALPLSHASIFIRQSIQIGDLDRARTDDLQRDRLAF